MIVCKTIAELRAAIAAARRAGRAIGLAPTMGNLHAGHGSLIARSHAAGDFTVVSIFVNPTQFGPSEDFQSYPRTPIEDLALCERCGADAVFMPAVEEVYPRPGLTAVAVAELTRRLCGASRPGHFDGVCTVVSKLFNMAGPDRAYFGQKDAQQLAVIRRMTADLNFPVEIVPCEIVRETDGLALSSRNVYLNDGERRQAVALSRALRVAADAVAAGASSTAAVAEAVRKYIHENAPDGVIDYVETVDPDTISPLERFEPGRPVLLALAVKFGRARLIDNALITRE